MEDPLPLDLLKEKYQKLQEPLDLLEDEEEDAERDF